MSDDINFYLARISNCELSDKQMAIVNNNLRLLISVRIGNIIYCMVSHYLK